MCQNIRLNGLVYGVQRHYQKYFSYIMAVSFIGGGNQRKPRLWQTLSHLTWDGLELTTLVVIGTDCIGIYKSNY